MLGLVAPMRDILRQYGVTIQIREMRSSSRGESRGMIRRIILLGDIRHFQLGAHEGSRNGDFGTIMTRCLFQT
jgi:hypothetical protein